jgi:signal transduction histidine kinase/ligand-binding sensor domain-containing protein/DNA-binding response OmpR family regulator
LCISCTQNSFGQPTPSITYLGIENGLSNNAIRCIYQDRRGFMWFGTYDGLNRYDGNNFKVFRNKFGDTASLINNWILAINEDLDNNIWIGTRQGVSVYNNVAGKFDNVYYISAANNQRKKITSVIRAILCDKEGNIFIATGDAGLLFYAKTATAAVQIPFAGDDHAETMPDVTSMATDQENNIWLFIVNKGLCRLKSGEKKIVRLNDTLPPASCIAIDRGVLWAGTGNGLYKYDIAANQCVQYYKDLPGQLTHKKVSTVFIDKMKNCWVGTDGGGINILNTITNKFEYLPAGNNNHTLTSESVYAIYEDRDARKWIGTLRGGIDIIDPRKDRFNTINHEPFNANSLISNFIFTFCEEPDGSVWVGTDGGGLSKWDRRHNRFTNYRHDTKDPSSLSDNFITSIERDESGDIWIATYLGGINRFNKATEKFKHYICINTKGNENKANYTLYKDKAGQIWTCTLTHGSLYRFNRAADRFEIFNAGLTDLFTMNQDNDGRLWAGSLTGLVRINSENKDYAFYDIGKPVRSIHEDKLGNFWLGTEGGGLILFDKKNNRIVKRYTTDDGLANNAVLNILEDKNGNLWMSTFNGISKFNIAAQKFSNYYQSDGLQGNQFNYNAALELQSGEFLFGGIKGFSLFNPDNILPVSNFPGLWLTGLRINNVAVGDAVNTYIKEKDKDKITAIQVPYKEAVFTFDFTALEYSAPDKIVYSYFMEGFDRVWNNAGNNRTATYTHLEEGNYSFRVRSTNVEGVWNRNEISLSITVLPPWYRSWWAYTVYALIAVVILYFYFYYRARQNKLKYEAAMATINAEKEKTEREKKQVELEKELVEHEKDKAQHARAIAEKETERVLLEKEKDINDKRISFFTNISHEFRTPLTLIINPVKDILQKSDVENDGNRQALSIVYRNARRMLSLIDQLLLFRKAESGADVVRITKLNFYELCKEVYLCFVQQAKAKQIDYAFECMNDQLEIYADREKMEIVLYNLISNALKYTPEHGKVSFTVTENPQEITITIADNGQGMDPREMDQLFTKFYRGGADKSSERPGFGIGLYLVKHFTEAQEGKISVQSVPGQGTFFTLFFKSVAAHPLQLNVSPVQNPAQGFLKELATEDITDIEKSSFENAADKSLIDLITEKAIVLLVEDDAGVRKYLAAVFKDKFTVYESSSGEDGLALARQFRPDIIISDINMQGISGIELCSKIKEDPSLNHIPVILLTGASSPDLKLAGVQGGADDYITKPFEKELLIARVTNLLRNRNNLRKYFFNEITLSQSRLKISSEYKLFLEKCIAIVEKHLDDDEFAIATLAAEIGMSHSTVYKKIKLISGQSLRGFIRFIRLRKAAELFINTNRNVNEVAFEVGINDAKFFREQFNKLFGMNPSGYIKKFRKPFENQYNLNQENK